MGDPRRAASRARGRQIPDGVDDAAALALPRSGLNYRCQPNGPPDCGTDPGGRGTSLCGGRRLISTGRSSGGLAPVVCEVFAAGPRLVASDGFAAAAGGSVRATASAAGASVVGAPTAGATLLPS